MDLPVWQALYQELEAKNFVPIAVAFDSEPSADGVHPQAEVSEHFRQLHAPR